MPPRIQTTIEKITQRAFSRFRKPEADNTWNSEREALNHLNMMRELSRQSLGEQIEKPLTVLPLEADKLGGIKILRYDTSMGPPETSNHKVKHILWFIAVPTPQNKVDIFNINTIQAGLTLEQKQAYLLTGEQKKKFLLFVSNLPLRLIKFEDFLVKEAEGPPYAGTYEQYKALTELKIDDFYPLYQKRERFADDKWVEVVIGNASKKTEQVQEKGIQPIGALQPT